MIDALEFVLLGEIQAEADLADAVMGGLRSVPAASRGPECALRRARLRAAVAQMDRVLEESEEALKLRPSRRDRLTAGNYNACARDLTWALDRCRHLQEMAGALEGHERIVDQNTSMEYAVLSVDIVAQHDRAQCLLRALQAIDEGDPGADAGEGSPANRTAVTFTQWVLGAVAVCGGRVCERDGCGCTSLQVLAKEDTKATVMCGRGGD